MSTRAQIKIKDSEDNNIHIYKHHDGYPEGVLPTLIPIVEGFFKSRGRDDEYLLAQIVRRFAVMDYIRDGAESFDKTYNGWGLDCCEHGDIEYLYEIDGKDIYINGELYKEGEIDNE